MTLIDVLTKFAEFIDYEKLKSQTSFNMFSCEYEFKRIGEKIESLSKFDSSGNLAVMYAAEEFERVMNSASIKVLDILKHPDGLNKELEMYRLFNSPEIEDIITRYVEDIDKVIRQNSNLIGERDLKQEKKVLLENIVGLTEGVNKLRVDVYLKGENIIPVLNILPEILVFDTTSEAVLQMENVKDGVYLAYINNNYTADGYFSIFVKSNGNLVSFHDRVDETYKGQHGNSRNGRWAEEHADSIFPYNHIFEYGDYDYKGYATSYRIDESKLAFLSQEADVYIPLIILMVTLGRNIDAKITNRPLKYIDSLVDVPLLTSTALTVPNNSLIAKNSRKLSLELDADKVIDGTYGEKFGGYLRANEEARFFIEKYGKDFVPGMIPPVNSEIEMVADEESLRKEIYRLMRMQLRNHVLRNMEKVYAEAGKKQGIESEHKNTVLRNKNRLIEVFARAYAGLGIEEFKTLNYNPEERTCDGITRAIGFSNDKGRDKIFKIEDDYSSYSIILNDRHKSSKHQYDGKYACPVTGAMPSIWVTFEPSDWNQLRALLGELPESLEGWRRTRLYNGNSILSATDPCNDIHNPAAFDMSRLFYKAGIDGYGEFDNFFKEMRYKNTAAYIKNISVGFSKRGIKKILEALEC